jgi:hypothetical protein
MTTNQNGDQHKEPVPGPALSPASAPAMEASACIASWDIFYQDGRGMECHLQLKAASVDAVLKQAKGAAAAIIEAGGRPSTRMAGRPHAAIAANNGKTESDPTDTKPAEVKQNGGNGNGSPREPSYVDEQGTRRCNRRLTDGAVCGRPVTEKEGRYGAFWSCPNFKAHAPNGAH